MEIGVVVHGPGIIDSGWAINIIDYLSNYGNVRCRLGGTMGRTAVIDAGLENVIDISMKLLPSESLEIFNTENVDVIFLLDYGKSQETGHVFGYTAFNHYFRKISNEDYLSTSHKSFYDSDIPVVQIERPGEEDGSIISWNVDVNRKIKQKKGLFSKSDGDESASEFVDLVHDLMDEFDLTKHSPEDVLNNYFSDSSQAADEEIVRERIADFPDDGSQFTYRRVHGASPGENILVNGFVIGYAESEAPILLACDDIIVDIIGGVVKSHGVEKLGPVDLSNAILKTGLLRKSKEVIPRVMDSDLLNINDVEMNSGSRDLENGRDSFKIAYVDHAAYDIYRFKNFDLVVTIGDDTTLVASDILYRFDIPILGITDGDLDKVVEKGFVNDKSIILEVASDYDDIVGINIYERLFASNTVLEIPYEEGFHSVDDFKKASFEVFLSYVEDVVKSVVPSFILKRGSDLEESLVMSDQGDYSDVEASYDEFDDNLDEFIDNFDDGHYEEQFVEESVPREEQFAEDDMPSEVFVEESSQDEGQSFEEPIEDLEDPSYYDELEENGEDLEDPAYYEELYVEEDLEDGFAESELPGEINVENSLDGSHVESEPVEEMFVEEHEIDDEYSHDDLVEDFFAELPQESIEEVYIDPDPIEEVSVSSESFIDYESPDNGESDIDYAGAIEEEESQFDDGMDYKAVRLSDSSKESIQKSKEEDFDDNGIMYEKASFVKSRDDDLEE